MFHGIASNETARPAKSGLAMNSHCSLYGLNNFDKFLYDLRRWWGSISKIEIVMLHSLLYELLSVISWGVKSNDCFDSEFLEDGNVLFRPQKFILYKHWKLLRTGPSVHCTVNWKPSIYPESPSSYLHFTVDNNAHTQPNRISWN